MSKYDILPAHLHSFADSAEFIIKKKYNLGNVQIEKEIDANLGWSPTLHWKTKTGFIACEVSERPLPIVLTQQYAEITASGLPVRIISAFPIEHNLSLKEYQHEKDKAKKFGIGILPVDSGKVGAIEYNGISIPLHLSNPKLVGIHKNLHAPIIHAFEIYMGSDPKHGVQEIGQIVEKIIVDLAAQAKKNGCLKSGGFVNSKTYYPQNNLINDLIMDKVIDNKVLKKCATYADDRNSVSHKPKSIQESKQQEERIRELFKTGLYLLEDLPQKIREKKFKFKY